jgi:rhodanese-related sulfurtransferase/TusA-related sulfurtransferase
MTTNVNIQADITLDCVGLACPMPLVKTKKAMDQLQSGQVIKMQATDKGSLADLQSWAKNTGNQYLGTIYEGNVMHHYVRKANPNEVKEAAKFPQIVSNEELQAKLSAGEQVTVLDVREPAEHAFHRVPGAISIPLGDLERRMNELAKEQALYVICRTGNRSDMACLQLAEHGFSNVYNVVPGMSGWNGATEGGAQ